MWLIAVSTAGSASRNRIPKQAKKLQEALHEEGMDKWYEYVPTIKDTFPTFWKFLQNLTGSDCACRTGGGPPDCGIRACARQKQIGLCPQCGEFPCRLIQDLAEHCPSLIQDGKHLQKIGLQKWIEEQEQRAKRGVVYADFRYSYRSLGSNAI